MLLFCQWFDSKLICSVLRNINPGNTLGFFNSSCQIQLYEDVPTCTLELILWRLLETFEMIWLSPDLEDCFWKRHTVECISQEVVSDFRLIQHFKIFSHRVNSEIIQWQWKKKKNMSSFQVMPEGVRKLIRHCFPCGLLRWQIRFRSCPTQ